MQEPESPGNASPRYAGAADGFFIRTGLVLAVAAAERQVDLGRQSELGLGLGLDRRHLVVVVSVTRRLVAHGDAYAHGRESVARRGNLVLPDVG
jgi:hypothetical protein